MKFLVVVFSICLVGALAQELNDAQKQKLRDHRDICMTETGAAKDEVDKAHKGEWEDNEKLRCFALCMMKRMGMMNDEGKLDEAVTRQRMGLTMSSEKVDEIMTKCKDMKGTTPCDTGYMMMKCYTENRETGMV